MMTAFPVAILAVTGVSLLASGQEPPSKPTRVFPAEVEQVTVDVVVLDKRGEPVTGLTRDDFTVLDEGQPQSIATFDVVRPGESAGARGPASPAARSSLATNLAKPTERSRLFVIVFDDLHMSPLNARAAKAAVASFVEKGLQEGDRVLLIATGGAAWWTTRLEAGRGDLLAVLKHLDGRRVQENAAERLTDFEAVQISVYHDATVANRVAQRFERYSTGARQAMQQSQQQRLLEQTTTGAIDPYIENRAFEAYVKLKSRLDLTLGVLERCFRALAESRDRKAVLLVSEGFANDPSNPMFKRTTEAARRANAALYFIDTRGLQGLSQAYSAEFGASLPEADLMSAIADVSQEGEGAAALAGDTGGFAVRNTNDFGTGAVRIGRESRSYYLLGYTPGDIPHDGRFRKIEVRIRNKALQVRARKGYYAPGGSSPTQAGAGSSSKKEQRDPEMQSALDAPGSMEGIPLRLTAYALQPSSVDQAHVLLAAEADVAKMSFPPGGGNGVLDTLLVVTSRETGELQRSDVKVELQRRAAPGPDQPIWYAFVRPFELTAGRYQAKLVARDGGSGRVGSVILEFDVPPLDKLRVSTPILTDTLQRTADGGISPTLVVRRDFKRTSQLFCRFDVFGAGKGPDGMPKVKAGHALRHAGGGIVGESAPATIQPTSIGALSRLIQIPLAGTSPGDYELVLTVVDEITGETRELVEPFSVTTDLKTAAR
jgi:VWFA-related protein